MHLPKFDYSKMEWDRWKAFHIDHDYPGMFTQFDTGEFVVCWRNWRPEKRCRYDNLHLQIVATDDKDCPALYIPGNPKPVFKSHLNHRGQQILLLDHDHKRAVSLDHWKADIVDSPLATIPERFINGPHNVAAYYAGPNSMPIGSPIRRFFPCPLAPDQRRHINELKDACMVWFKMQSDTDQESLKKQHRDVIAPVREFLDVSFAMLIADHRTAIALRGFDMIVKETHPWLTFESNVKFPETEVELQVTKHA